MLEKLKLAFSRKEEESADLAELLMAQRELEGEAEAAHIRLERVRMEVNGELLAAIAAGDEKRRTAARKKLDAAQADVAEIDHALAGLASRVEAATIAEGQKIILADREARADLAKQREEASGEMQRHIEAFCAAYTRFHEIGRQIEGKLGRRFIEQRGEADFYLRDAVNQQLVCRSPGNLIGNRDTLRMFTPLEFQRDGMLRNLDDYVRRQNARLLTGDFMTPAPQPAAA